MNRELAQQFLKWAKSIGIQELVLCAGARNAALVKELEGSEEFLVHTHFEERSAAFFAMGRTKQVGRPVPVITTSGTAAAELLPATIEAWHQNLPLILVTADRPSRFRGTGAPQSITQPGLFGSYVETCLDIEYIWQAPQDWSRQRPLHINLCFEDPLREQAQAQSSATSALIIQDVRKPIIIVSGLTARQAQETVPLLRSWRRPVVLESTSQLRHHRELQNCEFQVPDKSCRELEFDSVIRIGSVPTCAFWRDLENLSIPVFHYSDSSFKGMARPTELKPFAELFLSHFEFDEISASEMARDQKRAQFLQDIMQKYPLSETAWVRRLSLAVKPEDRVYLGNSLPIREWDLVSAKNVSEVYANRGVNGIDGQVSTFLGWCDEKASMNWGLLGDLTALYDVAGFWTLKQMSNTPLRVVVLNNGGGMIFRPLFNQAMFENRHTLHLKQVAELWSLPYLAVQSMDHRLDDLPKQCFVEIFVDPIDNGHCLEAWKTC